MPVERRDLVVIGIGQDFEGAGETRIAAQVRDEVVDQPADPSGEDELEARALGNAGVEQREPGLVDHAVTFARLDGRNQQRISIGLEARRQWHSAAAGRMSAPSVLTAVLPSARWLASQ